MKITNFEWIFKLGVIGLLMLNVTSKCILSVIFTSKEHVNKL